MARNARHSTLENRSARLRLAVRFKPYAGVRLARGVSLLYRRNKGNGTWVVKASDGHGRYWTKGVCEADDFSESNGSSILDFYAVQDVAKKLATRQTSDVGDDSRPATVAEALDAYERDLKTRNGDVQNARLPRKHLAGVPLLSKPVQLLGAKELRRWRDSLLAKDLQPSSVVRYAKGLRAALNLAASHDGRIINKAAWETGLEALPDATVARNVILDNASVSRFVNAAYAHDAKLGLLVDTLATTGARPSQAVRLLVEDLVGGARPKLRMPRSAKGGSKNRIMRREERVSVPITASLYAKLKQAAKGRSPDAPLLLQGSGSPWSERPGDNYRDRIADVIKSAGLAETVTLYALRHSSIVRMLLEHVSIELVAKLHDTSSAAISKHYASAIAEVEAADEVARRTLIDHEPVPLAPAADNVVALATAR
ncbi:site-specific integrase [Bradyrhizobium sp. UFLA05-153]